MRPLHLNRRALLRGAGGIAIGLPFLEVMEPRAATAAASDAIKRLVIMFSPNGTNDRTKFVPDATGPDFTLPVETAPLMPLQKNLLVVSGVNMQSAKDNMVGDLHSVGMSHMLTATPMVLGAFTEPGGLPVGFAGGISVDQHIAKKLVSPAKFPSLEFGAITLTDYGVHPFGRMLSAGPNQPVPPQDDPVSMFNRLFRDATSGTDAAAVQLLAQRRSVLDFVLEDISRLETKLGPTDRAKVDQHLTAIRNLEQRLNAPVSSCGADKPSPVVPNAQDKSKFDAIVKTQADLLTLALQCDKTRVATFQMSWARSMLSHPWVEVNDNHHDITHQAWTPALAKINTWYAAQVAYLATALQATDDGNGKTLLDNTILYWCGEVALGGDHNFDDFRVFILGSGAGSIVTGQHLHMEGGPAHNKLLVTLMNAMGVPDQTFGDPKYGSGPLPGILTGA